MVAPYVVDGPINGDAFEVYVAQILVPELKPGDVVIMDNLSNHKRPKVVKLIAAAGASVLYLLPYSPDFNSIERAFSKLKALLRKAAKRTVEGPWTAIGHLIDPFEPNECRNYFASCGYDANRTQTALEHSTPNQREPRVHHCPISAWALPRGRASLESDCL